MNEKYKSKNDPKFRKHVRELIQKASERSGKSYEEVAKIVTEDLRRETAILKSSIDPETPEALSRLMADIKEQRWGNEDA